jgi:4-methyl-5(b-hydroxyethyl)-thiazole monophosphate biosynthesis
MSRACVLLAPGFEEIEAVTIIDVLRRAGIETSVLGVGGKGPVRGSHDITVDADRSLADAESDSWDIVILPGGLPGATNLRDDPRVLALLRRQHESGKRLGAICAAPIALGAAGVLEGRKATSYPGFEKELRGATPSADRVVKDGNVITSRGPGTALEFALAIVADLEGKAAADKLRSGMLVAT